MGMHVMPCKPRDKNPLLRTWKEYQTKQPTEAEIEDWWTKWPDANVAIITGRGLLVVDLDGVGAEDLLHEVGIELPTNPPAVLTSGGVHAYLRAEQTTKNATRLLGAGEMGVDIRGDGGYVIAPPSVHASGVCYEWIEPIRPNEKMPLAPPKLVELLMTKGTYKPGNEAQGDLQNRATDATNERAREVSNQVGARVPSFTESASTLPRKPKWIEEALRGVGHGARDDTCVRLAAYFLSRGIPAGITTTLLIDWGTRCDPVFYEHEVRKCIASMVLRHGDPGDAELETDDGLTVEIRDVAFAMAREHDFPTPALATPYEQLNGYLHGGFRAGELIYLGARPGVGKTVFAVECARHAAKAGVRTLVVTREMLMTQLCERMVAQEGRMTTYSMRHDRAPDYLDVVARVASLPIYMSDRASTLLDIATACAECEPSFLVVDYLQLLGGQQREARERVEAISRGLKALAIQRKIPILCLSSVSRGNDSEAPTMARLRESGNLEHDADVVIMMHRLKGEAACEASVEKARQGETGVAHLVFDGRFTSLSD